MFALFQYPEYLGVVCKHSKGSWLIWKNHGGTVSSLVFLLGFYTVFLERLFGFVPEKNGADNANEPSKPTSL